MTELRTQSDRKAREQLRDVLAREQMTRLYQIRLQARPALESLSSRYVADRLKLTEEQKAKLAELTKGLQTKRSEMFRSMREASQEQRREAFQKYRKLTAEADKNALELLNDKQKKAFEDMKGEKFELQTRRRPRETT